MVPGVWIGSRAQASRSSSPPAWGGSAPAAGGVDEDVFTEGASRAPGHQRPSRIRAERATSRWQQQRPPRGSNSGAGAAALRLGRQQQGAAGLHAVWQGSLRGRDGADHTAEAISPGPRLETIVPEAARPILDAKVLGASKDPPGRAGRWTGLHGIQAGRMAWDRNAGHLPPSRALARFHPGQARLRGGCHEATPRRQVRAPYRRVVVPKTNYLTTLEFRLFPHSLLCAGEGSQWHFRM